MSDQNMPVADGASDRYNRVCQIFQDSLKVDAKARLEWIEVQAGGDEVLLAELKAMLLADEGFIEPTTKATELWNSESADQDK